MRAAGASFNSAVTLSCPNGLPTGAQCSFTPNPVTPGNSAAAVAMTVSTDLATIVGPYTVGVIATSGSLSHSLIESLTVSGSDFTMAVTQSPGNIDAGTQTAASLAITPTSTHGIQVNATCDASALAGVICTLTPANPILVNSGTPVNLTATITLPNSAAPGTYSIAITAQEGGGPAIQSRFPVTIIQ